MKPFSSIFSKIIFWLVLNLVLVAAVNIVFFKLESRLDLKAILGRQAMDRMRTAGWLIAHDLSKTSNNQWAEILARYADIYSIDFVLFLKSGKHFSSKEMSIPSQVSAAVLNSDWKKPYRKKDKKRKGQWFVDQPNHPEIPPEDAPPPPFSLKKRFGPKNRVAIHTQNPERHWSGIRIGIPSGGGRRLMPAMLIAVSDSITGHGFFFDPLPWIIAVCVVLMLSVLLWIPLVRHITRPLARMTNAAEQIAGGKFDVRIRESRADEIGRLARAINNMTARLGGYVKGQKRFLGDVAHELGSPIARIQFGLGALEQRVGQESRERVADVMEDVAHMSSLVNELLSFTRAEMSPGKVRLEKNRLLPIVQRAVERESTEAVDITIHVNSRIEVFVDPELLTRAISNLIRNAVIYAGTAGPVRIVADKQKKAVQIRVEDSGTGVPDELLDQLFEPFYRPEPSRNRDSGGVGLGLAIVKTCVEACKGTVTAKNLKPAGFSVAINLPRRVGA